MTIFSHYLKRYFANKSNNNNVNIDLLLKQSFDYSQITTLSRYLERHSVIRFNNSSVDIGLSLKQSFYYCCMP